MRRIFQVDHSSNITTDEADRHYEVIHSPYARTLIRREAPGVRRYAWNRVLASRDVRGRFNLPPAAWRFILFDLDDPCGSGHGGSLLPMDGGRRLLHDHVNFLTGMRPFDVTSEVVVDRRAGQCSSAKFLLTFDADTTADPAEVAATHDRTLLPVLAEAFERAVGARLFLANQVTAEAETAPIEEPGQRYTGAFLARSERARIDELYFDNQLAGMDFFAQVTAVLDTPGLGVVGGHLVREWVAVDRT